MNKELLVLRQSYDWLLFLGDKAIVQFVDETILSSSSAMEPVARAFKWSYDGSRAGGTQYTKVKVLLEAHDCLDNYFSSKDAAELDSWYNVLAPEEVTIDELRTELSTLATRTSV